MLDRPDPVHAVSGAALMASCAGFARWQKLSGSADELASMRTIQTALDGFGYRTSLLSHDAYISLPGTARVTVDGVSLTAITHSFSRPGRAAAPLVYVGEGREADFAGRDLAGAILLVEGIAGPPVAARAAQSGAAGQLHISPHEHLHEMCISPVWGSPGLDTLDRLPRTVTCTISHADGTALRDRLQHGGTPEVVLEAAVETGWRPTPILVAEMDAPGLDDATPDAPFILFSGHHDTWYFGVMDNGSANATMIEGARVLAAHRSAWRRGLRLCFWSGHSHGRYSSSAWYVDNHWAELERRCAVHVNVDSTGGLGATVLTEAAAAAELNGLATDAIAAETGDLHEGRRPGRNSDNSFWGIGIPTLFGAVSHQPPDPTPMPFRLGWWWHTPQDLLDKVDEANLVRDTRIVVHALWRLLTEPAMPLDYAAHAAALHTELDRLDQALQGRLSLQPLLSAAATLQEKAAGPQSDRVLMRLSRTLVPVDNTKGDRFAHDPALPQAPWPVLDPIRALASAAPDRVPFAAVDATRARNRMLHALHQALDALHA